MIFGTFLQWRDIRREFAITLLDWRLRWMTGNANTQMYQLGPFRYMRIRLKGMPEEHKRWRYSGIGAFIQVGHVGFDLSLAPFYWKLWIRRRDTRDAIAVGPLRFTAMLAMPVWQ